MQKVLSKNYLYVGLAAVAVMLAMIIVIINQPVRAQAIAVGEPNPSGTTQPAKVQKRLSQVKLKVCQQREKTIDNIMTRMGDRGVKQLDVFTKIADRTEFFYVKSGKVLSNYNALVDGVNAKKADAQTAVTAAQSTTVTFKCDGTNPKGVASSFKASLEAQNQALKAYKTAVKNLIVGVKSVQGTTSSTEGSKQ